MKRVLTFFALAVVLGALLLPTVSSGGTVRPEFLPSSVKIYGMTVGQWSARWFQWMLSMDVTSNPLNDTAPCAQGQLGPVWFLGGSITDVDVVKRNCTVPAQTTILIPIGSVECDSMQVDTPYYGATPAARLTCAQGLYANVTDRWAAVDNAPVLSAGTFYKDVVSPDFVVAVPSNGALGYPTSIKGTWGWMTAIGDYLVVTLPPGTHVIEVGSTNGGAFSSATYNLTVQ